jgi:prepilin-type N-terminal cleavage/methylation domain-containing protein
MLRKFKDSGFSLTEVLLAAGILAIGFMLVATTFPVGIKLTTVATERTIAAVATDEALAKMNIYGVDPNKLSYGSLRPFESGVLLSSRYTALETYFIALGMPVPDSIDALLKAESLYPSTEAADMNAEPAKYHWSALFLRTGINTIKSVIFVSRKAGVGTKFHYFNEDSNAWELVDWPVPVKVSVDRDGTDLLRINDDALLPAAYRTEEFINSGSVIVDDQTGYRYDVLERSRIDDHQIKLAQDWGGADSGFVWVVPPGLGSSRNPCITVEEH